MSFSSKAKYCAYDSWDLARPKTSPRSRLYQLPPIGIGTPSTESLTGYILLLAQEHCVSSFSLFRHELVPASDKHYFLRADSCFVGSNTVAKTMKALNGRTRSSQDWVLVLERLTHNRGLRSLTILTWQNVLIHRSLTKTVRAWCPQCLEEQRERDETVYEHLLWSLDTVDVCLHHQIQLETVCPHCHRQTPPFTYRVRLGHCSLCLRWLGHRDTAKTPRFQASDLEYKKWIADQMGQLIAAAPSQSSDPPRERIRQFIPMCIKQTTGGNVTAFADLLEIDRFVIYAWIRKHLPPTDAVLKICYRFGVSFFDLITKGNVYPQFELREQYEMLNQNGSKNVCRSDNLPRMRLLAALEENPTPSRREVADRLGYKLTRSLYIRFPDLAKMLTAKLQKSQSAEGQRLPTKDRNDDVLKLALQKALEKELPPSLSAIATNLGHDCTQGMRSRFPDLCNASRSDGQSIGAIIEMAFERASASCCSNIRHPAQRKLVSA
jgi:hypothetical protein